MLYLNDKEHLTYQRIVKELNLISKSVHDSYLYLYLILHMVANVVVL